MHEKVYKTMNRAGISSIIFGIILILVGVSVGVLSLINGGRLLKRKSDLLF